MRIANLQLSENAKKTTLSAEITFAGKKTQTAYFTLDSKHKDLLATDASPFLAAVLLPCMKSGEQITVEGSVSEQLLKNTKKIMKLVDAWKVGLKPVTITVEKKTKDIFKTKARGAFFTAGVDSFYTFLKHQKSKEKITHLVLVHGFDIPLENKQFFSKVKKTVEQVAKEAHVTAISLETNIGEIVEQRLVWDFSHGGALAAVGLLLRKGMKQLFIAGAVRNDQLFPYGTHPQLDKLWSTETLSVASDGGEYDRLEKITHFIAISPLALKYLRVCTQNLKGKYNCSRCYKCLITMISLEGADALRKSNTFETKLNLEAVKKMYYDYKLKYNVQGEQVLALFKKAKKNPELQEAIQYSLDQSKKARLSKQLFKTVAQWDQKYNDRRLYRLVFKMNTDGDRNALFTFLFRKGLLK